MLSIQDKSTWQHMWADWQQALILYFPRLLAVTVIILVTFVVAYYCKRIMKKIIIKQENRRPLVTYMASILTTTIILIGLITALATAGVNVTALVASLGLLGFSLGLAFKDLLANALSGLMILIHQPFKIGDRIEGFQFKGSVSDINLRYTTLMSEDNARVLIPNQNLVNATVTVL